MTRRVGYWIISAALATAPLVGCAQWGRNGAQGADGSRLTFWDRQPHGRGTGATNTPRSAQSENSKFASDGASVSDQTAGHDSGIVGSPVAETAAPRVDAPSSQAPLAPAEKPGNTLTSTKRQTFSANTHAAPVDSPAPPPVVTPLMEAPPLPVQHGASTHGASTAVVQPPGAAKADRVEREPFALALQCLIDNHPNEALQWLDKYDGPTKEFFLRLLPVLQLMTQKSFLESSPAKFAFLGEQMQGLADSLRPLSKLTIEKARFCKWISSYGIYEPMSEDHEFRCSTTSRSGDFVMLYVELGNFTSVFKNGMYETKLASSIEILDQNGKQVWFHSGFPEERMPNRSRTLRRDYSNKYTFFVPNYLRAGTYTLIINVRDETRPDEPPREASKALEFHLSSTSTGTP
jgi:hypothetical protein